MALQGDRLRHLRQEKGLSQRDLGRLVNVGANMVFRYENGLSDATTDTLTALAFALDASSDYLIGLSNNRHGQLGDSILTDDEQTVIDQLRREGWLGVGRLSLERLAK